MAKEILAIPEEKIMEVVLVIRTGLFHTNKCVSDETKDKLLEWCNKQQEYHEVIK